MDATALNNESCGAGADARVIPVDIAAAKAVAIARVLSETEHVPLIEATGRVLPSDVRASIDLPKFDNSAMDGYAVRIADFTGAGPWELSIRGRIAAGDFYAGQVANPNEAIRIFTGAPVPCRRHAGTLRTYRRSVRRDEAPATGRKHPARGRGCQSGKSPHGRG
jgi:molybdopterin molybdotransferase